MQMRGSPDILVKNLEFLLKADRYGPIYRVGGDYSEKSCKKQIKVSEKGAVN
jgi:hypothetical protein